MSYAQAKQIDVADIPVIDVAPLHQGSPAALDTIARAMRDAAESIGFFYVRNHGIPDSVLEGVDRVSRAFFARPLEDKLSCKPLDRHRGFLHIGQAKMHTGAKVDLKESFVWGRDVGADDPDYLAGNPMIGPNRWPAFLPEMRPAMNAFFDESNRCGQRLLRAFAASLGVAPDYFTGRFSKPITRGTAVYYPPQPPDAGEDQFGVAPHTDYGVLTLVHLDSSGGLQVRAKGGDWVEATPIPGTLVVNVGDLLARWTNDVFQSTPHRVVNRSGHERLSIAAFVDPDSDTPIHPVVPPGDTPRYQPVSCGDYIRGRYDASFAYRKG